MKLLSRGVGLIERAMDVTRVLGREGTMSLRGYELQLLVLAAERLSNRNRYAFFKQLVHPKFVRRDLNDSLVGIYFRETHSLLELNLPKRTNLARIHAVSSTGSVWVNITANFGEIAALTFDSPPAKVFANPFDIKAVTFGGEPNYDVENSLHEEMHGKEDKEHGIHDP